MLDREQLSGPTTAGALKNMLNNPQPRHSTRLHHNHVIC